MSNMISFKDVKFFKIHPHPEKGAGLQVGINSSGNVGLWCLEDKSKSFALSPAGAIQLAQLIMAEVAGVSSVAFYLAGGEREEGEEEKPRNLYETLDDGQSDLTDYDRDGDR